MANPEHLKIIKRGIRSWNRWRYFSSSIIPDLSGADLQKANLKNANLSDVNLERSKLIEADLSAASLHRANLRYANLSRAKLIETTLLKTNLNGANISKADLTRAYLYNTNLTDATLIESDLSFAICIKSDFSNANLRRAKIENADFRKSQLVGAKLGEAMLQRTNLSGADLSGADLCKAKLIATYLIKTDLSEAIITGAELSGAVCDNWVIEGIHCEYVFFDFGAKNRLPRGRNFRPNEFEELYKQLPTIEYIFEHGFTPIDAFLMDQIVQAINERNPKFELRLDSLQSRGQPHAVFTVLHKEYADEALAEIKTQYEDKIKIIESERDSFEKAFAMALKEPRTAIKRIEMIRDTYKIQGQAVAVGPGAHVHDINFNQIWKQLSTESDTTLLSEELTQLRLAMKKEAETLEHDKAVGEIAAAEAAAKDKEGPKALEHLKKAGKWAFSVAERIGTTVAAEALKKAMGL